ncbi:MAG: hypothetical protein UU80_C0006G0025 [candidate division WWE3 bacterium GW2011_GWA1_41_8]|jgi:hypothetical protein|uniref:Uncharacterized protein n=1 Tax=candidate division WWE3 bacterium GW2011_GWA1_41_8 TaxID=1619103 RepID=A0A0G0XC11_UNCKA|nr:MAG: hypothetical protein UU80_C0006G0025 [candidate division WWE3 bacterium GW2011_GWA1_41_8]
MLTNIRVLSGLLVFLASVIAGLYAYFTVQNQPLHTLAVAGAALSLYLLPDKGVYKYFRFLLVVITVAGIFNIAGYRAWEPFNLLFK